MAAVAVRAKTPAPASVAVYSVIPMAAEAVTAKTPAPGFLGDVLSQPDRPGSGQSEDARTRLRQRPGRLLDFKRYRIRPLRDRVGFVSRPDAQLAGIGIGRYEVVGEGPGVGGVGLGCEYLYRVA